MKTQSQTLARIMKYIEVKDGHWLWTGEKVVNGRRSGYAVVEVHGVRRTVSRVVLELALGAPLEKGLEACHRCRERACVNPLHLYAGTRSQNMQDSVREGTHFQAKKTHCPKGHDYSPANYANTLRICKTCRGEQAKARAATKKAKKVLTNVL